MKMRLVKDKNFYIKLMAYMLPVAAQQAINMGVNMMDTIMLGQLGEIDISASSLANSFYSIYQIFCMGIAGGCSVMAAHYWGAKEKKKTKEVFTLSLLLSAGLSLFFALITLAAPGGIMRLFTDDEAVAASGIAYLRITAFVYFFHGTSLVTTMMMRTVGQQKLGLYVSIISFGINIFANWVFIFGKLGAPEMGIAGAALGTLISRVVEFVVTFWFVLRADQKLKMRIRDYRKLPSAEVLHQYMRIGAAVLISDGLLGFGSTVLSMILGRMGTDVVAANSICMVLDRLVVVIVNGISQASSILVGHTIGEGKKQEAQLQGETFLILGILFGIINAVIIWLAGPLTLGLYEVTENTKTITIEMMHAYSFIVVFQAIQSIMTKGVLRGGGDTKFLLKADIAFLWAASIPLGILVGLVLRWPAWITQIALRIDFIIKSVWCISRLKSGKWIHDVNRIGERTSRS